MQVKTIISLVAVCFIVLLAVAACGQSTPPAHSTTGSPSVSAPAGGTDGASLLQARCTVCHSTARITRTKATRAQWETLVNQMVGRGAQLTPDEQNVLLDYLAKTYGP